MAGKGGAGGVRTLVQIRNTKRLLHAYLLIIYSSAARSATNLIYTLSPIDLTFLSRNPEKPALRSDASYSHPAERGVRETHCY